MCAGSFTLCDDESMPSTPTEVVSQILANPTDIDHVRSLCAPDVVYVSLDYDDPELKRVMPWCGTAHGPEAIVKTFVDVNRFWDNDIFCVWW